MKKKEDKNTPHKRFKTFFIWLTISLILFLIVSQLSIFAAAYLLEIDWQINMVSSFLPQVNFNVTQEIYTHINAFAIVISSFTLFLIFLVATFKPLRSPEAKSRAMALYFAMIASFIQYFTFHVFKVQTENSSNIQQAGLIVTVLCIVTSALMLTKLNKKHTTPR